MKANSFLSTTGLSMSQAQSVSNLCNQRATDILSEINAINNYSETVNHNGISYTLVAPVPIPTNIINLIMEKAQLHSCQGYLMEAIKQKNALIEEIKQKRYVSEIAMPQAPKKEFPNLQTEVTEKWGWDQLTLQEKAEFIEAESYAAHIGQVIHKSGKLDSLRKELPTIPGIRWMELKKDEKTPILVNIHHTQDRLLELHNALAEEHRNYEQRVNYFKAKVKNLVTLENARIAKENAIEYGRVFEINQKLTKEFTVEYDAAVDTNTKLAQEFEESRQREINAASKLRIFIPEQFQPVINHFLTKNGEDEDK